VVVRRDDQSELMLRVPVASVVQSLMRSPPGSPEHGACAPSAETSSGFGGDGGSTPRSRASALLRRSALASGVWGRRSATTAASETAVRYVTITLPVGGGATFVHKVDGREMSFSAPEGKQAGDEHEFAFEIMADGRVRDLDNVLRFVTIELPVNGGQTFRHSVDGRILTLLAPASLQAGDLYEFKFTHAGGQWAEEPTMAPPEFAYTPRGNKLAGSYSSLMQGGLARGMDEDWAPMSDLHQRERPPKERSRQSSSSLRKQTASPASASSSIVNSASVRAEATSSILQHL